MEMKGGDARDAGEGRWGSLAQGECPGPGSRWEGRDPLADVFPGEDDAAGLALETADVPLLVQRQE